MSQQHKKQFVSAYLECAVWASSTDGYHEEQGQPEYDIDDNSELAPCTAISMMRDCLAFLTEHNETLSNLYVEHDYTYEQAGQDFWLTRCGHGAGFWDRGLGAVGNMLSDSAKVYGSVHLYVADDGLVYQ